MNYEKQGMLQNARLRGSEISSRVGNNRDYLRFQPVSTNTNSKSRQKHTRIAELDQGNSDILSTDKENSGIKDVHCHKKAYTAKRL